MPQTRKYDSNAKRQAAYRQRAIQSRAAQLQARALPASPAIPTMPGTARWSAALNQALSQLETVRDEMQEYYTERSQTWQEGERGEEFQQKLDTLEELIDRLSEMTE